VHQRRDRAAGRQGVAVGFAPADRSDLGGIAGSHER
jgi:hypothetical protein